MMAARGIPDPHKRGVENGRGLRLVYLVHLFYPESHSGTEKFVLQMARAMQTRGHPVQVVTYGKQRPRRFWRWLGIKLLQQRYRYGSVPVLAVRHTARPPLYKFQIEDEIERAFARRCLRRWRPDLVHVGHAMRVSGFAWAAQELGIPTLLTLTDYWLLCPKYILVDSQGALCTGPEQGAACRRACPELDPAFIQRRLALAEQLVRRAGAVVAPSAHLVQVFQREWPWLAPHLVPHGIHPWTQQQRIYEPGDPLVFAYAGSLSRHKGVHTLIEAFSGVQSPNARLHIHGAGMEEAALRAQARADPRVVFCGSYAEGQAARVFGEMDVLIAPSEWPENRPFVISEALACGLPVVTTTLGGAAEMLEQGVSGWLVPPGNPPALRAVLQDLVDQPQQLNAYKTAIANLSFQTVEMEAAAYEALYGELAGKMDRRS